MIRIGVPMLNKAVIRTKCVFTLWFVTGSDRIIVAPNHVGSRFWLIPPVNFDRVFELDLESDDPDNAYSVEFHRDEGEVVDPNPVDVPLMRPESLQEKIDRMIVDRLESQAVEKGFETVTEANDFDIPDEDPDPTSPYELTEAQEEMPISELQEAMEKPNDEQQSDKPVVGELRQDKGNAEGAKPEVGGEAGAGETGKVEESGVRSAKTASSSGVPSA